ncbi:hypothetical protein DHEL01_v201342 [Diaporthe helianthi]|uniref:PH domain-containing protein n=1 Tax=Diaporthe helianthi TaxID=158607 RepID=A0A2P5ICN3_DIAHE|nr:hypothetical protein DHEL01_v201342 [Diaporthe helianthi]
MTSKIAGAVLRRAIPRAENEVLSNFAKNFDSEDPFYYVESHPNQGGMSEKKKKEKRKFKNYKKGLMGKEIYRPPGLSEAKHDHDVAILASVRRRSWHLDMSLFHWCGFRFGWSVIIGLVPVLGDIIDCLLAYWIIRKADQINGGLPSKIKNRMYLNVAADFAIGLVPLLGDIADALYKANSRNTWLLEDYLIKKAKEEAKIGQTQEYAEPGDDLEAGRAAPQQPKATKVIKGKQTQR